MRANLNCLVTLAIVAASSGLTNNLQVQTPAMQASPATRIQATPQSEQAGSAVVAVGNVTDTGIDGGTRQLQDGDNVYAGDGITTGDDSYADINFEDGGRILLRPDTEFHIQQFHYDPAAHGYALSPAQASAAPASTPPAPPADQAPQEHESALFSLIKGGFQAITGFIGHVEHQDYAVETPVATIGIRGTRYEVRYCANDCGPGEQGLFTGVGKGAISLRNQAGESIATAGHYGFIASHSEAFQMLHQPPRALQQMRLPYQYRLRDYSNFHTLQIRRQQRWRQSAQQRPGPQNPRGFHAYHEMTNNRETEKSRNHETNQEHKKKHAHQEDKRDCNGPDCR